MNASAIWVPCLEMPIKNILKTVVCHTNVYDNSILLNHINALLPFNIFKAVFTIYVSRAKNQLLLILSHSFIAVTVITIIKNIFIAKTIF